MQSIYAASAAGIWLFFGGSILFAVVFPKWFKINLGLITRVEKQIPVRADSLEKLLQGLGLVLAVAVAYHNLLAFDFTHLPRKRKSLYGDRVAGCLNAQGCPGSVGLIVGRVLIQKPRLDLVSEKRCYCRRTVANAGRISPDFP
jgi:hypothetical protein